MKLVLSMHCYSELYRPSETVKIEMKSNLFTVWPEIVELKSLRSVVAPLIMSECFCIAFEYFEAFIQTAHIYCIL